MSYPMVPVTADRPGSLMPTGFLHLPYELRRQIYCHCIPRRKLIDVSRPSIPLDPPEDDRYMDDPEGTLEDPEDDRYMEHDFLDPHSRINVLRLSKQISEECLDILYGENIFRVILNDEGEYCLRENFTEENRRRMRSLVITAELCFSETSMPDDSLWATILPSLKKLLIVAEQPITAKGYWNAPTLEEETGQWLKWIRPYLECFGQHMPETLSATVDDDGRKETRELVQKYLPPSCECNILLWAISSFSGGVSLWSRGIGMTMAAGQVRGMSSRRATVVWRLHPNHCFHHQDIKCQPEAIDGIGWQTADDSARVPLIVSRSSNKLRKAPALLKAYLYHIARRDSSRSSVG